MAFSRFRSLALSVALFAAAQAAFAAATNIDLPATGQRYGWMENAGWLNLQGDIANGVHVGGTYLGGFAWHENFGWINFGDGFTTGGQYSNTSGEDFGVNMDLSGNLSGYAWGENVGWIAFDTTPAGGGRVHIDQSTGRFSGYAWGENIGWLAFDTVDPAHVAKAPGFTRAYDWNLFH